MRIKAFITDFGRTVGFRNIACVNLFIVLNPCMVAL